MEYFVELSETVQDLMNNEIELSNFMAMIIYEEAGVIAREFSAAQRMIEFSVSERVAEMDGAEGDGFMCRACQTGVFETFIKTFEYAPDAIVANAKVPVIDAVQFYI